MNKPDARDEIRELLEHLVGDKVPLCGERDFGFTLLKRPKVTTFGCTPDEARNKLIDDTLTRAEKKLLCANQACPKRGFTCAPFLAMWEDDWVRIRPYRAKACEKTSQVGFMATWRPGRAFLLACTCVPGTV